VFDYPAATWLPPVRKAALFLALLLPCLPALAQELAPEAPTGRQEKPLATAGKAMAVTADPAATGAAIAILGKGGSAVDAMIAAQLVLGLVEPQSSGLGGGGFLVHWDAATAQLTTLDGRETAPLEAKPDLFIGPDGQPMEFFSAVVGGRSVGTPGTVALLEEAHRRHGKLAWADLFQPAIRLAEKGFAVSGRLNALISESAESLYRQDAARNYFLSEEGVPLFPGAKRINKEYAETLKAIAAGGSKAFYEGAIAEDIVATVRGDPDNPGLLSIADFAAYKVVEREPVCADYREYRVCGMGPPSSGTIAVGQILMMAEPFGLAARDPGDPQAWRVIGDASRLAFADRDLFIADPAFVRQPKGLLDQRYMDERARLLEGTNALPQEAVKAGTPPSDHTHFLAPGTAPEMPSTTHLSIVDAAGNAVALTSTIENGFGSRLMVRGFLLNNELTDFSFEPERDGKPVANRVEPGKRPRSSMAPVIVLKDGKPVIVLGSPGGSRIINYVAQALIAMLDWGMDAQQAAAMPHLANRFGVFELEEGTDAEALAPDLEGIGYKTSVAELNSGLHIIEIKPDRLEGGADPRREGVAAGL
jgi:gamma-glutamyltranspeptidase / glutathione hydrolase